MRVSWDEYFMRMAELVSTRSTCLRRQVGAILVKDRRVIATGYNGAPKGLEHCEKTGCLREQLGIKSGTHYELCRGVHAEQNAIVNAAFHGISTGGSTLYCTHQPCLTCARMIINAGIVRIVHQGNFDDERAVLFLNEAGIDITDLS